MLITPASLLHKLREPSETSAWGRFVDLYTPLLYYWAQKQGQQESDCADLVQDVFLILFKKLPEFEYDPNQSFHAWLKTLFVNRYRSRQRQRDLHCVPIAQSEPVETPSNSAIDPDDTRFLIRQAFRLIERDFSPLHQQVFRAYVLQEMPAEDVAALYETSLSTVYAIKSKILSRLRQEMRHLIDGF